MDDSAAYCAIDLGGRAFLNFNADLNAIPLVNFLQNLLKNSSAPYALE